jgi:hypothetical protein
MQVGVQSVVRHKVGNPKLRDITHSAHPPCWMSVQHRLHYSRISSKFDMTYCTLHIYKAHFSVSGSMDNPVFIICGCNTLYTTTCRYCSHLKLY